MAQPNPGPPPIPPRVDLGEEEKKTPDGGHPTISIISARPMDQNSTLPTIHFNNDKTEVNTHEGNINNNQQSVNFQVTAQVPKRPAPVLNKPSKPAPSAPKRPPPKPEDRKIKPPVASVRSKNKSFKRDGGIGSVFYVDTSADTPMDTKLSPAPAVISNNSPNDTVQKQKQSASQPNFKSKPTLPPARKSKGKHEPKASEENTVVNNKVKPPDKVVSKPKLKPTIITAKTPKQLDKSDELKVENMNISITAKSTDTDRPSRPSFPPSATTGELIENQPERPKAPPSTVKEEQGNIEKKKEKKMGLKNESSEKKRPKSKPARPPVAKESSRSKPSRPPPAKPNTEKKSSSKTRDTSSTEAKIANKPALNKASGPPRAQAKYDYAGETDDDLTFKAGDTIMLTSKVDDEWLVGYLENNVIHQGLFPSSFVEIVVALKDQPNKVPLFRNGNDIQGKLRMNLNSLSENVSEFLECDAVPSEPYATALHDFQGQSEGELSFTSGQTIILLERINVEWLKGKLDTSVGIFPANFVQIERDLPQIKNPNHSQAQANMNLEISEEWCKAIHDYQGEHNDDLNFVAGTKIKIIERVSDDWLKGEYSGKSGMFPASFVQFISDTSKTSQDLSLVTAIHDYHGDNPDDLSFKTGDKVKVIKRINSDWLMGESNGKQGLFPSSFVDQQPESTSVIHASANEKELSKESNCLAKAIHEFTGENPGELHFSVGDVIQIIREIDSNWSEGKINDVLGIFPASFVEIQSPVSKEDVYAKALYDFAGESEHDLSFKAGDTVKILEQVNDDWCSGSIGGRTGHFPSSFVQVLASK